MNRFRSLERAGVRLAFGTDAPVTPLAGWATVRGAVEHWQQGERLSVKSAFEAATKGAHWAAFNDNAGEIRVGALASLAIWNVDDTELEGPAPCRDWMGTSCRCAQQRSRPAGSSTDPSRLSFASEAIK
jgi:predicted amidohydrolase YtcJ